MDKKLSITSWPEDDRPREKLLKQGAQSLSNAELLAILIGTGYAETDAVMVMKQVLSQCNNNLNALGKMTASELMSFKGIGEAKAVTILAACELGKRRAQSDVIEQETLSSAEGYKLIKAVQLSKGGITETAVDVRIVVKEALLCNATVVVFCHNHPSNNIQPSRADDQLTRQLKEGCDFLRLFFLDHIIIGDGKFFSYREEGRL